MQELLKTGKRREMAIRNTFSIAVLSTTSPMEIGATIWHRDFASLVASPMSYFYLTCLPCLKSPCQLEGEALPTWRFTARRSLRSAAS